MSYAALYDEFRTDSGVSDDLQYAQCKNDKCALYVETDDISPDGICIECVGTFAKCVSCDEIFETEEMVKITYDGHEPEMFCSECDSEWRKV